MCRLKAKKKKSQTTQIMINPAPSDQHKLAQCYVIKAIPT